MKKYSSLRTKIILGTVIAVGLLAAVLVAITISIINYLTETILRETIPPMAKTAALAVEGNLIIKAADMETGLNEILGNLSISSNSTAYIINEQGEFIAHGDTDRLKTGEDINTDYPGEEEVTRILERVKEGQTEWARLNTGVNAKIVSFAHISGAPWVLIIEAPLKDYTDAIRGDIIVSISVFIAALIFFSVLANSLISRFVTEPLLSITETTNDINRGIFERRLPNTLLKRQDEIGQLSRAFVSMSLLIEKLIGEIDRITFAIGTGRLNQRVKISSMEGNFFKIVSGVNDALDVICYHLDAIPVAIALFNENKQMLYSNNAMNEFLVMHDLLDCDDGLLEKIAGSGSFATELTLDPRAAAVFDPVLSNPVPFSTDIAILGHNGGSNFTLTLQRIAVEFANKNPSNKNSSCVILILNDVTMLTRAKIDAEMASRAKSDSLSRMSHEIRTPMNAVIGMTQIAKSSSDMEKIRNCLEQVENSSSHLLGVINDILDFSKMESGKLLLDITEFSLAENLDFVVSMMLPKARERNVSIKFTAKNIENDGISADSLRLNQVLINLLSNAIKFSHEGGEVQLDVRELGSEGGFSSFSFEVIDHGIGISAYQASRLFRPFEQADGSITRNYGGTGLGLVISKNLVEMMGGKIFLDSKEEEGSTFTFTIHCAAKKTAVKKDGNLPVLSSSGNYDFSGKRCLVADDIGINREIIIELLSGTNIIMETAENGREVVEKFSSMGEGFFDVILMDMQMPVLDGCSATLEIRKIEKQWIAAKPDYRQIPIIAMTANVMQEDIQKAIESGMNAHLGKPIELEALYRTIAEQLQNRTHHAN